MIEVVFGKGACGSLRVAQNYGVGEYRGGVIGVFVYKSDGSQPAEEELNEAQKRAEEKDRREWEKAIPLRGKPDDIYCFDIALSVGEISETELGAQRRAVLEQAYAVWPTDDMVQRIEETLDNAKAALHAVLERCSAGEALRVWYSHNPDEMCGMHWLLAQLHNIKQRGPVYLVKLPEWEHTGENTVITRTGWGEIAPGEWGRYQSLQQEVQPAFLGYCASKWRALKAENAPLRVLLNGQLQSAPEDIYDSFIRREIDAQPEVFVEARVIGNVLGKYQLGIGDAWVACRIEKMISAGKLEVLERAPENDLIYRQTLRKVPGI